jgi:hypothetical protein
LELLVLLSVELLELELLELHPLEELPALDAIHYLQRSIEFRIYHPSV